MVSEFDTYLKCSDGVYYYFVNGEWRCSESGKTIKVLNPFDQSVVGEIQACTRNEIDESIEIARKNMKCWNEISISDRAKILRKAAELMEILKVDLGKILEKEIAKPKKQAIAEIQRTADIFRATADAGTQIEGETIVSDAFSGFSKNKISIVSRVPLGVILCISPFNYPFNLMGSKVAPALIAGNSVIMKPPTQGALTTLAFGEILKQAGVPNGVINIVTGKGSEIGDYLIQHPGIDMIAFTGSSDTGKRIASIAGMKPLLLELGGKDAAIILPDCDFDATVDNIVKGAFSYSGQRCTAVKRVLVLPEIADRLSQAIAEKTKKLTVGKPENNCDIGPLISPDQVTFVQGLIDDAVSKGAKCLTENKREGNILWPVVLDNVTFDMRIAWEEPFGPVLPIIRVNDIKEAIVISNRSEYGLQGMIFTENIDLAFNIAKELEVGTVQINGQSARGPDHFPFIGTKASGLGTQGVKYSILAMSRPKSIVLNLSDRGKWNFC